MSPALLVHIQAHLDEDLSLAVLSAKALLSPAHFQRTFQALVGETPKNASGNTGSSPKRFREQL